MTLKIHPHSLRPSWWTAHEPVHRLPSTHVDVLVLKMTGKKQSSNVTNKTDRKSLNSRVFIGNLNTALVKRATVEALFSPYGHVVGCSVHKGYAFVQYATERSARIAVTRENGRVLAGQTLDINMAGEPNPQRPRMAEKIPLFAPYGSYDADFSYYREEFYEKFCEAPGELHFVPHALPVAKRARSLMSFPRKDKGGFPLRSTPQFQFTSISTNAPHVGSHDLHTIKRELRQIKFKIDSLLESLQRMEKPLNVKKDLAESLMENGSEERSQGQCTEDSMEGDGDGDEDGEEYADGKEEEDDTRKKGSKQIFDMEERC
uniref:RALY RNA binding protein like n=2 Tax=Eptatretus burgeri TaxID=7764 RepID=A0A8C4WRR7_EPTBU